MWFPGILSEKTRRISQAPAEERLRNPQSKKTHLPFSESQTTTQLQQRIRRRGGVGGRRMARGSRMARGWRVGGCTRPHREHVRIRHLFAAHVSGIRCGCLDWCGRSLLCLDWCGRLHQQSAPENNSNTQSWALVQTLLACGRSVVRHFQLV